LIVAEVNKGKQLANLEKDELFGIDKLNKVRSLIPAVTHVDYSARVQTVNKKTNPDYHMLINEFFKLTGCPIIVNTSFNVRGEPIVHSPEDAFKCFMGTDLDILVIENFILKKKDQNKELFRSYINKYKLD
jgi:carbamoyltransferase